MSALLVGYARCSTDQQDLIAQPDALLGLGVEAERIYVNHGLTGTNRERPGCARRWPPVGPERAPLPTQVGGGCSAVHDVPRKPSTSLLSRPWCWQPT